MTSFGAKCDGGRKLRLSFVRTLEGRVSWFFPSSNKLNGFHIYNKLVSQISIEILVYFVNCRHFRRGYALPSTGRPSLAVLRHVGEEGVHRRHRGHFKLGAIVYSARAVIIVITFVVITVTIRGWASVKMYN